MADLIGRDSDTASDIPQEGLACVMGYEDLWSSEDWALFPNSIVPLVITRRADHAGDILDVENTLATPEQVPGWMMSFDRPKRRRPSLYHNRDTRTRVLQVLQQSGLLKPGQDPGEVYDWWAATLDNTKDVPGAVSVQYAGAAITGGHYDESIIIDPGWIAGEDMANSDAILAICQGLDRQVGDNWVANGIAGTLLSGNSEWQGKTDKTLQAILDAISAPPPIDIVTLAAEIVKQLIAEAGGVVPLTEAQVTDACKAALRGVVFQVP